MSNSSLLEKSGTGGRDVSISVARFVAMVMIVVCHMFQYYESELAYWLNVGVEIFFVISGFLYGSKEIDAPIDFIVRNFKKILIPYWLFLLAAIAAYALLTPSALGLRSIIRAFTCSGTMTGLGHLWFVGYILFCYLLTPYLYWLRKYVQKCSIRKTVLIYLGIFVAVQLLGYLFHSYFKPERISCYILGFFLADLFSRFSGKQTAALKWLIALAAVCFVAVEVYFKYILCFELAGWQGMALRVVYHYSHLLLGTALFLAFYGRFKNARYGKLLRLSDRYSYPVYLVHLLFILSPLSLMGLLEIKVVDWAIVILCAVVCAVVLYHSSQWIEKKVFGK